MQSRESTANKTVGTNNKTTVTLAHNVTAGTYWSTVQLSSVFMAAW